MGTSWGTRMNCENCGAPMKVVDGHRHYFCDFCDSQVLASPEGGQARCSADGLDCSSEPAGISCPDCPAGDELMHGLLDGHKVDYCPTCFGISLDAEAFGAVVRDRRIAYSGPDDVPAPANQAALDRRRDCPVCDATMEAHPYYGPGNVVVDSCCRCRRVWLDQGELTTIVRASGRRGRPGVVRQRGGLKAPPGSMSADTTANVGTASDTLLKDSGASPYEWQADSLFDKAIKKASSSRVNRGRGWDGIFRSIFDLD